MAPSTTLSGFAHAAIAVRDLASAVDVYERLFGYAPGQRETRQDVDVACFALANARIELHQPSGRAPALRDHLEQNGEGMYEIGFRTTNAKVTAERLAGRGLGPVALQPRGGSPRPAESAEPQRLELRRSQTRGVRIVIVEESQGSPAIAARSSVGRLDHVVVRTGAPDAAIHLYRDQLSIRLALDRSFEERGVRLIFFRIAGVTVEVAARLGDMEDTKQTDLLSGLAYGVEDVAAAQARVRSAGFDVSEVRTGNKPGTLVCTVREPTHSVPTLLIGPDPAASQGGRAAEV